MAVKSSKAVPGRRQGRKKIRGDRRHKWASVAMGASRPQPPAAASGLGAWRPQWWLLGRVKSGTFVSRPYCGGPPLL